MTEQPSIELSRPEDGVAVLHMNDDSGRNVFSEAFVDAFLERLDEAAANDELRALILRGLPGVFAGGADQASLIALAEGTWQVKDLVIPERLLSFPLPIVAACEGHAVGGGLVMALCCDMMVLAEQSRYGANFMNMGFTPGMGCTALLPMAFGPLVAAEMMFTGKRYKGRELAGRVPVNYVLPRDDVFAKAQDLAAQIAEKPRHALVVLRDALALPKRIALGEARNREDLMHRVTFSADDIKQRLLDTYGG